VSQLGGQELGVVGVDWGKCVNTRLPSMPSHQNVWWGNLLVSFQESFWVRNQRDPERRMSRGSAAE
jgi:hypothetical protein